MKRPLTIALAFSFAFASDPQSGLRAAEEPQREPFAVEYYYKVKWGHFGEFMELYKRNHYPVMKRLQELGDIVEMRAAYPQHHAGEESRWDFRITLVWKDAETAHADTDRSAIPRL